MSILDQRADESPLACVVAPFSADERSRWQQLGAAWSAKVDEVRELPDGFALRIGHDAATIMAAAEWMTLDRRCCPFMAFTLAIEREGGPAWVHLTGRPGTKEFLRAALEERRVRGGAG
jgi:hypothetical protein